MAARLNARHDSTTRTKIQASQLINRLTAHVLGKAEMQPSQVTAALGLLRKVIPDLAAIQHSGEVTHHYVAQLPPVADSTESWLRQLSSGALSQSPKFDS